MVYQIKPPQSEIERQQYYDLRWRILRAPWQQPRGTERDEYEDIAIHATAIDSRGNMLGVARLHQTDNATAQIRYMAVEENVQNQGIGKTLLHYLEEQAIALGVRVVTLNARENCIGFYIKQGYVITGTGHVLYGEIRHKKMQKHLT